ncbi:E3 ubiquitin-protein ligase TRAIP-like [Ornithodoros turicata]|uniref:E3 ubiquitin-protein ligase TRAIP-like n=1 Tax=Ornithodoros turicata TaxID=34597 RepID=UPI00313991D9
MKLICSICMDIIDHFNIGTLTAASCGHVFHEVCLMKWVSSNKTCPTCRKPVQKRQIIKLYFDTGEVEDIDLGRLQNKLNAAEAEVQSVTLERSKLLRDLETCKSLVVVQENEAAKYKEKYMDTLGELSAAKMQSRTLRKEVAEKRALTAEVEALQSKVTTYENIKRIVDGTTKEAEDILTTYGEGFGTLKQLATYCVLLKRELQASNDSRAQLRQQVGELRKETSFKASRLMEKEASIKKWQAEAIRFKELLLAAEAKWESREKSVSHEKLLFESPAPERLKRPRLTNPEETPSPHVASPSLRVVTNAWRAKPSSSAVQDGSESAVLTPRLVMTSNFFKPKPSSDTFQSIIRTGYNGFGGHSKHIIPSRKKK